MSLRIQAPRIVEDRRPKAGKGDVSDLPKQRKGLREISNIPTNVTKKVGDLKISTTSRQKTVGNEKLLQVAPNAPIQRFDFPKQVIQDKKKVVEKKVDEKAVNKETIEDIDKLHSNNVFLVSEYAKDVYAYLMRLEIKFSIPKWPLPSSKITSGMRTILIDWLMDVHLEYNLLQETIHTAASILDRYLSLDTSVEKSVFQLVGICALSLATKYEEITAPEVDDFIYLCKNAFTRKDLLEMEKKILWSLSFDLGRPVSVVFLRRFNMAAKADKLQHCFSKYFVDSVLLDSKFCHISPSLTAAAAAFIAMCIINKSYDQSLWTSTMQCYSTYRFSDVQPVSSLMASSIIKSYKSKYDSVRRKYAQSSFLGVSLRTQASLDILKSIASISSPIDI